MGVKSALRNCFLGEYIISLYHILMCRVMPKIIDDETAVKRLYKKKSGKELDLNNPQTFAEKISWYKLNDKKPIMQQCADKVAVHKYLSDLGYSEYLNEVYGIYDNIDDIDLDKLPNQFVIKAAHGSQMIYIVKDKKTFNWKQAKRMIKSWLRQDIYWSGREWVYKNMPKRVLVEKYLEDEHGELRDYKFFCYNGAPEYVQIDIGRFSNHFRNYYDINKNLLHCCDSEKLPYLDNIPFPINDEIYEKMKQICIDLARPFQQVRIDLYLLGEKIYFGEFTFFDGGGTSLFFPDEWNYKFSEQWKICK